MSSNLLEQEKLDPRVKRTRALIGQAFSEVLAEKGFQAVSVQDITDRAGVNRTTFYLHFADKYALLDYNISQLFHAELEKRMLNICHYSPENLRSLIVAVAEFIAFSNGHCSSTDAQFEALVEAQVKRQVQELVKAWGENNAFGVDARAMAIAVSWAVYGLALDWSHAKKRPPVEDFAEMISPLILSILGLRPPVLA
jgi:AcrR family transcriptional regulator